MSSHKSKMKSANISAIIVTYNSSKYIAKCIQSFRKCDLIKEIIVIDNNSIDESVKQIQKIKDKKIRLVLNYDNEGFSKAINKGITISSGRYVLLVNPDTILNFDSIYDLYKQCCKNNVGIVGGKALRTDGSVHGSYVKKPDIFIYLFDFTNLGKIFVNNRWHRKFYYMDTEEPQHPVEVDAVSGGYMLISMKVINRIGLFDENFFMYLEDIDFCNRAKESGFKVIYSPNFPILHVGGASSKNRIKTNMSAWIRSRDYYLRKYFRHYYPFIHPLVNIEASLMKLRLYNDS